MHVSLCIDFAEDTGCVYLTTISVIKQHDHWASTCYVAQAQRGTEPFFWM